MVEINSINKLCRYLEKKSYQANEYSIDNEQETMEYMLPHMNNSCLMIPTDKHNLKKSNNLIGILFCPPGHQLAKSEILDNLDIFHEQSTDNIDFLCIGYQEFHPSLTHKTVTEVNGRKWAFNVKAFNEIVIEFEKKTTWKFSGETELILLEVIQEENISLNYEKVIVFNLEKMNKDNAISSVRNFFLEIFNYSKGNNPSIKNLSNLLACNNTKKLSFEYIMQKLSGSFYKTNKHYVKKDISKRT